MIKTSLTIILGFATSLLSCAQQQYQLDSVVNKWSHYETYTHIARQEFDSISRIFVSENEVRTANGKRNEGSRQTVQYDERDNKLIEIDSYWHKEMKQWLDRKKMVKTYNDDNQILSHTEYEMQRGVWTPILKDTYEFEEKSATDTRYRYIGKQWIPIYKNTSLFNEKGKEVLRFHYQWDHMSGTWLYWLQHENIFLKDSLLLDSITYERKNDQWTNSEKTTYKYVSETDKIADRIVYTGTGNGWQFKHLTQIKYYQAVRREEVFNWSETTNDWVAENFREVYTDQHGRDTDFVAFIWDIDSSEYRRHIQGMTVYDGQDRVVQTQEIRYEDGLITSGMEVLFDFDQDGNLYRQTHRSLIGKRWIVQETTEFTFHKEIIMRNEQGDTYVLDRAQIGHENTANNTHAIDSIRNYRHLDGEKVLQEEWQYYYSITD